MIIIEGPDNCGKSTLAKSLSVMLDIPVVHEDVPQDLYPALRTLALMPYRPYQIYDRVTCISDLVYGPIVREDSIYGEKKWGVLDTFLKNKPLVISCTSKDYGKFGERRDMIGVRENSDELYTRYAYVMERVNILSRMRGGTFCNYDYSVGGNHKAILLLCQSHLKKIHAEEIFATNLGNNE